MKKKIIMMVTDNPDDKRLAIGALQKNNNVNAVMVARDGTEALDYLFGTGIYTDRDESKKPKVILLDLNLHKMDGLEVLRHLRKNERKKLLPVVAFSSSEDERDLTECYRLGANSYIRRPLGSIQFDEVINHLVQYWIFFNESPS